MDNGQLDPIEDFEPAGPPLPVEIGGPETRLTGPPDSFRSGLGLRGPRPLATSGSS